MLNFRWVYINIKKKHHHRSPKSVDGLEMMFHDSFHFPKGRVSDCHWFPTQVMKTKSPFLVSYISRRWILKSRQILLMEEILNGSVSPAFTRFIHPRWLFGDFFYQLYFFGGTFLEQVNHHATSRSFMMAEIFRLGLPLAKRFSTKSQSRL